jgi:Hexameric tyrosine-coordinated heme protein (HTHP)
MSENSSIVFKTNLGNIDMNNAPEITLIPNNSLLTETPEEGRQLAVKMARLIIKLTQPDEEKRNQLQSALWQ